MYFAFWDCWHTILSSTRKRNASDGFEPDLQFLCGKQRVMSWVQRAEHRGNEVELENILPPPCSRSEEKTLARLVADWWKILGGPFQRGLWTCVGRCQPDLPKNNKIHIKLQQHKAKCPFLVYALFTSTTYSRFRGCTGVITRVWSGLWIFAGQQTIPQFSSAKETCYWKQASSYLNCVTIQRPLLENQSHAVLYLNFANNLLQCSYTIHRYNNEKAFL